MDIQTCFVFQKTIWRTRWKNIPEPKPCCWKKADRCYSRTTSSMRVRSDNLRFQSSTLVSIFEIAFFVVTTSDKASRFEIGIVEGEGKGWGKRNWFTGMGSDFLDATTHLYKRSCPSVRRSIRPSTCLSHVIFARWILPFLRVKSHQMTP